VWEWITTSENAVSIHRWKGRELSLNSNNFSPHILAHEKHMWKKNSTKPHGPKVYIRKNWREGEARTRKKNHHPILQLTYTNSSPATERMPKTPRGRRRRSIPTQVREKRISRPLPRPTKSDSQGPTKERKLGSGALSRTFQQILVLVLFSRVFLENTKVVTVVSIPRKLQHGNKFKNPNILKKKILAWMCRGMYQQPSGPAEEPRWAENDVQPLSERQSKDTEELEGEEEGEERF